MHFSRIRLNPQALSTVRRLPPFDSPYREHQMLWQLFETAPADERDFLFRREQNTTLPGFYVLSRRPLASSDGLWQIDTKHYQPRLHCEQTLAFSLRANPVITRKDSNGKSKRHDLVMDLKKQSAWQTQDHDQRPGLPDLMQQAGERWLTTRLEKAGARLVSVRAEAYQQHRHQKGDKNKPIRFSTLDLSGLLTVTDPERFARVLNNGIGPAKAFGCGLLLVRRP
jgi:CRISPR system Cascade subunit CasE